MKTPPDKAAALPEKIDGDYLPYGTKGVHVEDYNDLYTAAVAQIEALHTKLIESSEKQNHLESQIEALKKDAERWQFGVANGFPSHYTQTHPTNKALGWRMPSQCPPIGEEYDEADYPYYE